VAFLSGMIRPVGTASDPVVFIIYIGMVVFFGLLLRWLWRLQITHLRRAPTIEKECGIAC
jgi:hypothetical protein